MPRPGSISVFVPCSFNVRDWAGLCAVGVPFVTAPSPLLDPRCLAALNTGIIFVAPFPVTLTLNVHDRHARVPVCAIRYLYYKLVAQPSPVNGHQLQPSGSDGVIPLTV
eukprot:363330-Chlamydomonas_euryale.AAC.28